MGSISTVKAGPVTLLTGAAGGIGAALARRLAAAGHRLVLTDMASEPLQRLSREIEKSGGEVAFLVADSRVRESSQACVDLAVTTFGRLDHLTTCAGTSRATTLIEQDDCDWDDLLDINLSAVFRVSKAAARQMILQRAAGSIVHVSSIAHANGGGNLAYGAAKAGVATLTFGMAHQLGPHGIRVNAVAPGIIDTSMVRDGFAQGFETLVQQASERTPLGRLGQADEVVNVVAFLLSEGASFVNGALVPITGGIEFLPPISKFAKPR